MGGFWFFWTMWLVVLYLTFFYDSKVRSYYLSFLFVIMIVTLFSFDLYDVTINSGAVLLLLFGYWLLRKENKIPLFKTMLLSVGIALLCGWLEFVYYYEPVWMLYSHSVTSIVLISALVIFLGKRLRYRLSALLTGYFQGQIGFYFFLMVTSRAGPEMYVIGSLESLNVFALSFLVVSLFNGVEWMATRLRERVLSSLGPGYIQPKKVNV
ncbi:YphA family membrane protein [Alteribacter aurantiacus]|uniref:YphA family membrane protein n=1 Tax=Alteribacter aurantiacus TaxID=254410 RepID=UPI000411DF05|nr:hypothetical protein [Alteribacter aurantiacus]